MALALKTGDSVLIDGAVYRMLHRALSGEICFQDWENGNLLQISEEELEEKYLEGNTTFGALTALQSRLKPTSDAEDPKRREDWKNENLALDFGSLPPARQAEARRRKVYVDAVIQKGTPTRRAQTWPAIIDVAGRAIGDSRKPSWQTVGRWLRRYLANRCDIRSLLSGNASKGRRRQVRLDAEQEVLDGALKLWLTEAQPTKEWVYQQVIAAYAKARREGKHVTKNWALPCRATVFRRLSEIDRYEQVRRREGKRAADYLFETVGPGKPATFRLEVVEIDHTRADVWVIDHVTGWLLGRPWMTIAIDRYTRMIVGVYIGFEHPSTNSVMQCIRNMIYPKVKMLKEMGVQGPWNPYGVPVTVMVDNAQEFQSDSVRDTLAVLNITIAQQPANRPEFKGIVERAMRTIKEKGLTWMPGRVRVFVKDSRDYDPTEFACITLDEFRRYFFQWLIFDYTNKTHTGIMDVPGRRWEEEVAKRAVWIPNHISDLDSVLGLRKTGFISRRGIRFRNLFYQSTELTRIRRNPKYPRKVQFTVDPNDLGSIRVTHPADQNTFEVDATFKDYANGLTLYQHTLIRTALLKRNQSYQNQDELLEGRQHLREDSLELLKKGRIKNRAQVTRQAGIGVMQSQGEPDGPSEASPQRSLEQRGEAKRLLLESDRDVSLQQIVKNDMDEEENPTDPDLDQVNEGQGSDGKASASAPKRQKSKRAPKKAASARSSEVSTAAHGKQGAQHSKSIDPLSCDEDIETLPISERPSGRRFGPEDNS